MNKKTNIIVSGVILLLLIAVQASEAETRIYLMGRGNLFLSSGSAADYRPTQNDFPLMDSHQTFGFGMGARWGKSFFFGAETHLNLAGETTLRDPSDNDSVTVETYSFSDLLAVAGYTLYRSRAVTLALEAGVGGAMLLKAEKKRYTSTLGLDVVIKPPSTKTCFSGFAGVGMEYLFSDSVGLYLSGRFQLLALEKSESAIVLLAGILYRF